MEFVTGEINPDRAMEIILKKDPSLTDWELRALVRDCLQSKPHVGIALAVLISQIVLADPDPERRRDRALIAEFGEMHRRWGHFFVKKETQK